MPAAAKIVVDFDPNLDFSKYKTFAYIGGIDSLVMLQVNPDLTKNRVHRSATGELVKKGLREVQPNENTDIVVRYWANSETELSAGANWAGDFGSTMSQPSVRAKVPCRSI